MRKIIEKLHEKRSATRSELVELLENPYCDVELFRTADSVRKKIYGKDVFMRGLIEFTNYCKNDCYYCGIRRSNEKAERYRLTPDEIMECCSKGYALGFKTFVLQGGEDPFFTDEILCGIVKNIKSKYYDCAVTLSLGERSFDSFKALREAGADRYLLRHETANEVHYYKIHPNEMSYQNRVKCLFQLKELGYQVGAGFMVGTPYQKLENIVDDLLFLRHLDPQMVGIGPFIPHDDTPFGKLSEDDTKIFPSPFLTGKFKLQTTLKCIALTRLLLPNALIPATTALGTIDGKGRELGIKAGANVVMPNLSPLGMRDKYLLYNNKICTGDETAECVACMRRRVAGSGYMLVNYRGDYVV